MKRIFSFLLTAVLLAAAGIFLITENPNVDDFSRWYVKNNPTEMGTFFDDAYTVMVSQQTRTKDYVVFTVFEVKKAKYVGIAGHFWGRDSVEETKRNASEIIENVRQQLEDGSTPPGQETK